MKLTESEFFPTITDSGVEELYHFCDSILYKAGRQIPRNQFEDVRHAMVLRCLEKLSKYDASKGVPLGGYLYWQCRGAISMWANHNKRDIAVSAERLALLKAGYDISEF